jgi:hypothetical protein
MPEEQKNSQEVERRINLAERLARMDGKLEAIQKTQDRFEEIFKKLPCGEHDKLLAGLSVKLSFFGIAGGALVLIAEWIFKKL